MYSSIVDEFSGSAIAGDTADIQLYDVNIFNGTSAHSTWAVDCNNWLGFSVISSRFFNNKSSQGSAISAKTEAGNPIFSKFVIESS